MSLKIISNNLLMNRILSFLLLAVTALSGWALNEERAEEIRNDDTMVYGEGTGETQSEADKNALNDLMSKISVNVKSQYASRMESMSHNGEISESSSMRMVIDTYSQGHLNNTQSLIISRAPNAHVMRYISRDEINAMFTARQDKAVIYTQEAQKALEHLKLGSALRYYYWSLTLVKSLQYPDKAVYTDSEGQQHFLIVWLPQQIEDVMSNITVKVTEHSETDATLFFTYEDQPIKEVDFTFYNGNSWTTLNSVKNGMAHIELRPGVEVNNLKIRYEYEYTAQSGMDNEVEGVLNIFDPVFFQSAEIALAGDATTWKEAVSKKAFQQQVATIKEAKTSTLDEVDGRKPYQKAMEQVELAVLRGKYDEARDLFTDDGWEMMDQLLHFGRAKMLSKQSYGFYDLGENRVVCRSLVMTFSFPNNNRTFTEDVTFTFNADKKIEAVSFGLGADANDDIFNRAIANDGTRIWSEASVLALTTFLENYKTAFALKKTRLSRGRI